jgi:hypothetical protein
MLLGGKRMKIRKIIACLLFLSGLALYAGIPVLAAGTDDCHGHWAEAQVDSFLEKGYINLYADDAFKPDADITQGEFTDLINRAFALGGAAVLKADRPDAAVTRAEAAGVIAGLLKLNLSGDASILESFKDAAGIPAAQGGALAAALDKKLIVGYVDGTVRPLRHITRAEAVAILYRSLKTGFPAAPATGTFEGYLIDKHCFAKRSPENESRMCLQMEMCAESGYGLAIKQRDGKFVFYAFDDNGQKLSKDLLSSSKNEGAFRISVEGTLGIDGIKAASIKEK